MAHEIEQHDGLMLASGQPAWHGLGTVIQGTATVDEALRIAKLDWPVEAWPLAAVSPTGEHIVDPKKRVTVRTDVPMVLGVVGPQYEAIQNRALAEFCSLLAQQGDTVQVETAGSIRNGQKVWFLLRGESFSVRAFGKAEDQMLSYICVSNGHDGMTALRCTPTNIRVVCRNTLSGVIPMNDNYERVSRVKVGHYVARHVGDVKRKVEEARQALGLYRRSLAETGKCIDHLVAKDMSSAELRRFWASLYAKTVEAIPDDPKTEQQQKARDKAANALQWIEAKFGEQEPDYGATLWLGLNAFTDWAQHAAGRSLRDQVAASQQRAASAMFGTAADRTNQALAFALAW